MFNPFNPLNPFGAAVVPIGFAVGFGQQRQRLRRIDTGGIYALSTNGVSLDTVNSQTVYGINPCDYRELPCESIILLTIHADVPTGGETFPVMLALPNNGQSTTTTSNTSENTGVRKVNIVDSQGNNVTGASVQGTTERLLYLNKRTGVARFMEFTVPAATAASVTPSAPTN